MCFWQKHKQQLILRQSTTEVARVGNSRCRMPETEVEKNRNRSCKKRKLKSKKAETEVEKAETEVEKIWNWSRIPRIVVRRAFWRQTKCRVSLPILGIGACLTHQNASTGIAFTALNDISLFVAVIKESFYSRKKYFLRSSDLVLSRSTDHNTSISNVFSYPFCSLDIYFWKILLPDDSFLLCVVSFTDRDTIYVEFMKMYLFTTYIFASFSIFIHKSVSLLLKKKNKCV